MLNKLHWVLGFVVWLGMVGVSRGTWVRDVLGLGRCVYGGWVVSFFLVLWWCGGFTWNVVGCWILFSCCVSRETWVMLVKEIFCVCSRVFWCLIASRCFTWNVGCFLVWVGVVFWVLVFLVGGGCFTWNMEASVAGKNDSASQHIDACDHFLEVWKSKLNGIFFRFVPCWRGWSYQQLNKLHRACLCGWMLNCWKSVI